MDEKAYQKLVKLFEEFFGFTGGEILHQTLITLDATDPDLLDTRQKIKLVDNILEDVFSQMVSPTKINFLRSRLYSILDINLTDEEYSQRFLHAGR